MKHIPTLAFLLVFSSSALGQEVSLQAMDGKFTAEVILNEELNAPALIDLGATTFFVTTWRAPSIYYGARR